MNGRSAAASSSISRSREVDQRLDFASAVVEAMRRIGETCAGVAGLERHCVGPQPDPNTARSQMDVLDRAARMRRKRSGHGVRRHHIAQELHFAPGERRTETVAPRATGWIDELSNARRPG